MNIGMLKGVMTLLLPNVRHSNCISVEWLFTEWNPFTLTKMERPMGHIRP